MKLNRGFSIIELLVALTILGILLAAGLPNLFSWLSSSRIVAVPDFYIDAFKRAREGAINGNCASRVVLNDNDNGQFNWQIDWCSPTSTTVCDSTTDNWSTVNSPVSSVAGKPKGPSIFHSANELPSSNLLKTTTKNNNIEVYFTSTGWLNTTVPNNIQTMLFTSVSTDIVPVQITINLAGVAERCIPSLSSTDSGACP